MREKIASNGFYDIAVDAAKNRIYLIIKGFWSSKDLVPNFIGDIGKAARDRRPGFTALLNLTHMELPPAEVGAVHKQARRFLFYVGLTCTADVVRDELLKKAVDEYAAEATVEREVFDTVTDAEEWLDGAEKNQAPAGFDRGSMHGELFPVALGSRRPLMP